MKTAPLAAPTAEPVIRPDIITFGGRYIDFLDVDQNVYDIEDIAHALGNMCRFTGHTNAFYSIAQHSVLVSRIVPDEVALAGLLHDAAEAYLGDVAKPLKQLLPDYCEIEERVERSLFEQLGIPYPLPASVKRADRILLATEKRDLMPAHGRSCGSDDWALIADIQPLPERIIPVPPWAAKQMFLARVDELTAVALS